MTGASAASYLLILLFLFLPSTTAETHTQDDSVAFDLTFGDPENDHDPAHNGSKSHPDSAHGSKHEKGHEGGIHVASWRYDHVRVPLIVTTFILLVAIVKILFHHTKKVAETIPESCMLILLGLAIGTIFTFAAPDELLFLKFDPDFFFLVLLPPIILEAAYSLKDRAFIENLGTIMLYAVFGTIMNAALIAGGLILLLKVGLLGSLQIKVFDCLIFSALIAAVDPVAVLAIFEEVGVNKMLYYMVFGESLFNDAVTVVLYNLMVSFSGMETTTLGDVGLGLASFLASSGGAIFIGLLFGLFSALITKYTSKIRVVEPTVMFGMAYLSYLVAELFHFSGIISIICCGLNQCQYASENISSKSYITVHYFSKVASSVSESMIFIILGVMLVQDRSIWLKWSTAFSLYSLFLCLIVRFLVVFFISYLVNSFLLGIRQISLSEQCIMSSGGLRGAVSFSLVFMLNGDMNAKDTLMTATLVIILFTVFVQGITLKPLVRILSISLQHKETDLFSEMNHGIVDNVTAGIEEIIGHFGTHYFRNLGQYVSQRFLRPAIQKHPRQRGQSLISAYQECKLQVDLKRNQSTASEIPDSETLWNELRVLDNSNVAQSFAPTLLDAHDENSRDVRRRKPTAPNADAEAQPLPDTNQVVTHIRDLIRKPYYKTKHYLSGDRNLKRDDSEHRLDEESKHRENMRSILRRNSHKPSEVRRALFPTIATFTVLNTLDEDNDEEDREQKGRKDSKKYRNSQKASKSSMKPKFSLEVPKIVESLADSSDDDETDHMLKRK